ncbi:TonB-dependent receptor [Flavihumibacter petaseus]|uniref:Putative TonB-dependent receptor n=1 Tax=Flavihumibacter petaseus NBRC 106054 TaxID=1220578 RepID=A0A0E9MW75_9BACT|nr:TonB-dependent receptor [Flavihumibacter petaseus]GAO41681.1 putative TonB-dependent receptor [Flavihumibacter petaseus NBRC 106054]
MKRFSLLLLSAFFYSTGIAQTSSDISGTIKDRQGRPVRGATIHIIESRLFAISDSAGHFSFVAPADRLQLELSATGFANKVVTWHKGDPVVWQLEESRTQLDEVVVTAEKRETQLQKLPVSVTALTGKQVNDLQLWNAKDLTAVVPNFFSADPGDKRNVISIRGITSSSYDPAVATYIDGVNQFGLDTYIAQLLDIERIEVLRGPQGTLYGRNAMGGVVNIVTRKPTGKPSGFAEVSIGNYGQQRYSAGFRTPLIPGKLFIGAAALYEKSNGYYTNDFDQSRYDRQHAFSGSYSLDYYPGADWAISLNVKQQQNRNNGPFPLVMGKEDAFASPYHLNQNAKTELIDNTMNAVASIRYSRNKFQLLSQTAYQNNYKYYDDPIDADFSPIDGITIINNYGRDWNRVQVWTEELRLSSPAGNKNPLQWTAGVYLFIQDNPVKQATHFGNDAELVGADHPNFSLINTSIGKNRGLAGYGQATYTVSPKWSITGGLRYDLEKRELSVLGEYQDDSESQPQFAYRPDTAASRNFSSFSPKLSINYQPAAQQLLFLSYSKGFRTGGLTPLASDPSQPPLFGFDPEHSHNWELGWKWRNKRNNWQLNMAAFYSIVNDVQVPTLILPDAVTITRNTGKMTSKGLEAELIAKPLRDLEVSWAAGITDAAYDELKIAANGNETDLKGSRQIFTPDLTSLITVQYRSILIPSLKLEGIARAEWKYLGMQYFDLANTLEQTPYHVLNIRAGIMLKQITVSGWVKNLTDTRYIGYAYDFGAVNLAAPRRYGLTLQYRW